MKRSTLTYGMVGGGPNSFIGDIHRKSILLDTRAELVCGCFSRDKEISSKTGINLRLSQDRVYNDYKEMIKAEVKRPDKIDFVVIATPNKTHYDIAKSFLLSGINVVCDKPLCNEIEHAEELTRLTKEKDLLFAVTYTYTGYNMTKFARQLIEEGQIGEVISVSAEYLYGKPVDERFQNGDRSPLAGRKTNSLNAAASHCTANIGVHIENTVSYITGLDIKGVSAKLYYFGQEQELHVNMMVEYNNGASGLYTCSEVVPGYHNALSIRIFGTNGTIEWHQVTPDFLKVTFGSQPPQILTRGTDDVHGCAADIKRLPGGHPEGFYVAFANIYRSYINAVLKKVNNEPLNKDDLDFPDVREGMNGVKFVHAVIASGNRNSEWVYY